MISIIVAVSPSSPLQRYLVQAPWWKAQQLLLALVMELKKQSLGLKKKEILLMEEIRHHLGCIKPCKLWGYLPYQLLSRISSMNRMKPFLEDFLGGGWTLQKDPAAGLQHWCRAPPPVGNMEGSWKLQFQQINVLQADFLGWNLIPPFSKMLQCIILKYIILFFIVFFYVSTITPTLLNGSLLWH